MLRSKLFSGILVALAVFLVAVCSMSWHSINSTSRGYEQARSRLAHAAHAINNKHSESYYHGKVAVLMYHCVNPSINSSGTVSPQRLDGDLALLAQKGFNLVSAGQVADFLQGKTDLPDNAVLLTFDDGYREMHQYALPVLKKHQAPALLFLIGQYIGSKPAFLTWPQVRDLEESGLVTIGGHTDNQHYGVVTPAEMVQPATVTRLYDSQKGQLQSQRAYLERMQADCRSFQSLLQKELVHGTQYFAYPYGAYSPELISVLKANGFKYMFTVLEGVNNVLHDKARLCRINAPKRSSSAALVNTIINLAASPANYTREQPAAWSPQWKQ